MSSPGPAVAVQRPDWRCYLIVTLLISLLALGLTEFSMHPGHLLEVRETVNALDHGALRRLAPKLLRATHRERIAELVGSMRVEVTATPEPLESSLD